MKKSKRTLIKKLDKLFSEKIRERDGRCLRCEKRKSLQCCHIFSRVKMNTRWDMENAITLDYACHIFWGHRNPIDFTIFIEKLLGKEKLKELRQRSLMVKKWSIEELEEKYQELLKYKPEELCL